MLIVNKPQDHVMGMLVGYPKGTAERRLLLMLAGFFDGSGPSRSGGRYVMAGFVAFCPTWADIAKEWDAALAEEPAIPKFKLALSRNREWRKQVGIAESQVPAKIERLSRIVAPPKTLFSVITSISEADFKTVVQEMNVRGDKRLRATLGKFIFKTPYTFAFHNAVSITLEKVRRLGIIGDQVDFVFDRENHLFDDANGLLQKTRRFFHPDYFAMLGDAVQRDEDKVLPLQAADLVAGLAKDHCNDPDNPKLRSQILALAGRDDHNISRHLSADHMRQIISQLLEPMPEGWKPPYDWGVPL